MRDGSTYRANRRKKPRRTPELTPEQEARIAEATAVHERETQFAARRALGIWARTGGRVNVLKGETEDGRR